MIVVKKWRSRWDSTESRLEQKAGAMSVRKMGLVVVRCGWPGQKGFIDKHYSKKEV
jgi:hypothetical protein